MAETEEKLRRKLARLEDRNARLTSMVEDLHYKWGEALHQASRLATLLAATAEKPGLEAVPPCPGAPGAVPGRLGDTKILAGQDKSDI